MNTRLQSPFINDWNAKFSNDSEQSRVIKQHGCVDNNDGYVNNTVCQQNNARGYGVQCRTSVVHHSLQVRAENNCRSRRNIDSNVLVYLHSILMVISAIGNITVLVLLIKRRMRTPSRLDIMLTHLAIADLMVSWKLFYLN